MDTTLQKIETVRMARWGKQMQISHIILIQSLIRGFITRRSLTGGVISSKFQTKDWRNSRLWFVGGRKNECEKHQINIIERIVGDKLSKTRERIHIEDTCIIEKGTLVGADGYDLTENFDGKLVMGGTTYYFNLKFVCGSGGAQTRTLREVYHFVRAQMLTIQSAGLSNCYFINILDGDESFKQREKFAYLMNLPKFEKVRRFMFCGDTCEFRKWWRSRGDIV